MPCGTISDQSACPNSACLMHRYYGRSSTDSSEIPFRCDGYLPGAVVRDQRGIPLPLTELPPFLRALMMTDGTVTKILEAYFWEPVAVDTIEQRFEEAQAAVPWVGVRQGDLCLVRDAQLRGTHSGRTYAEAFSLIRTELIPTDFRRRLIDREIGIGALIRDSGLESYREILDVGLERSEDGADSVFRTYRIFIDRQAVILITECFTLDLYRDGHAG
jgi:chorismate-pyruvate lyase